MRYEVTKPNARLIVTVEDGIVVEAISLTHACFNANFLGQPWTQVAAHFKEEGFLIHRGN